MGSYFHRDFTINEKGDCVPVEEDYVYPSKPQLFDLENDIGETTNVIDRHPEVAKELRALYAKWDKQMAGPCDPQGRPKGARKKK